MQATRKRRTIQLPPDQFDLEHPFIEWFAAYHKRGAASCVAVTDAAGRSGGDIFMGPIASRRFSIGLADDKVPVLGVAEDDVGAVMSLSWSGAAFVRRVRRRDWVALSCADARIEGASAGVPIAMRMWLPCVDGLLDGWLEIDKRPSTLRVVSAAIRRGKPIPKEGTPLALLPLSFAGDWKADIGKTEIETV